MGRFTRTKKLGTCPLKLLAHLVLTLVVLSPFVPAAAGQQSVLLPPPRSTAVATRNGQRHGGSGP